MQERDERIREIARLMFAFGKRSLSAFPNELSQTDINRFVDAITKDPTLKNDPAAKREVRKQLREYIKHDPNLMRLYGFRITRKRGLNDSL
jgi:hypothetical protein